MLAQADVLLRISRCSYNKGVSQMLVKFTLHSGSFISKWSELNNLDPTKTGLSLEFPFRFEMSPAKTPSTVDSKPLKLDEILARKFHETSPHVSCPRQLSTLTLSWQSRGYLSTVQPVSYGKCLVASNDLTPGTVVEKFEGPEVDYSTVHGDHKNYVLNYSPPGSAEYTGW